VPVSGFGSNLVDGEQYRLMMIELRFSNVLHIERSFVSIYDLIVTFMEVKVFDEPVSRLVKDAP
jgi:hypothetical protein